MIASAGGTDDPWVHLWDAKTGKELHRFEAGVFGLAFSPDSKMLAACGDVARAAGGIVLWSTKTGARENVLKGDGTGKAHLLSFTADGTRLWAVDRADSVSAWETGKEGKLVVSRRALGALRASAVVAGGGARAEFLAVGGRKGIHFLNSAGKELGVLESKGQNEFTAVASRDDLLAGGTTTGEVGVWQLNGLDKPQALKDWHEPNGKIMALTFPEVAKDPRLITVSVGSKGIQVCVWDPKKAKELSRVTLDGLPKYRGGKDLPTALLSADGKRVTVVDGSSQRLRVWDAATGKELSVANGHERAVRHVAFLPDGKTVASVGADGLLLWTVGTDERPRRVAEPARWDNALAISPDGACVALLNQKGAVEVRDTASGKLQREITTPSGMICLALAPDGKALAFGTDRGAQLLAPAAEDPRRLGADMGSATAVAFSPDGKLVATAQPDGLHLWDVKRGEHLRKLSRGPDPWVGYLAFDPEGHTLAAAAVRFGNAVALYDVGTGRELRRCRRSGAGFQSLTFARGGRLVVVCDGDGLTLWETASGAEVLHLTGHAAAANVVAASPDGNRLVTGSADTTALLWDLAAAWKETAPKRPEGKAPASPDDLWRDLRSDGATAYRAVWALALERDRALSLARRELAGPGKAPQREEIGRLVADLDSPDAKVRARAIRELRRIGPPADSALRTALAAATSDTLQARLRAVIADLESEDRFTPDNHAHYASRVVDLLELIGTTEARKLLEALARDGATWALQQEAKAALARRPPPRPPAP
jgi:WD40 repeat protein